MAALPKLREDSSSPLGSGTPGLRPTDVPNPLDRAEARHTSAVAYVAGIRSATLLRWGTLLVILFQVAYMADDLVASPTTFDATINLHLLNILIGAIAFAATYTGLTPRYWRELCVALCAGLMLSTSKIALVSGNFELLFISIVALVIGAGTLAPWEGGWQAAIGWIGIICFYRLESGRPMLDRYAFMHWMGLLMVLLVAQANSWMQRSYRRQIAEKIGALETQHRELHHQMSIGDRLAAEREVTLQALAEREATLRRIFDSALDIIAVTRFSDGAYLQVNEQFSKVMGFTAEEVSGVPALALGVWIDSGARAEFRRRIERDGWVRNLEMDFKLKDGRVVPFLLNAVAVEVDGERCILSVCRDVSDIKEGERRLRESEEKFRQIFEKSADIVIVSDLDTGRIVEVNDQFVKLAGIARERVIGRSIVEFGFYPDPGVRDALIRQLREKGFVQNYEVQLQGRETASPTPALISAVMVTLGGHNCAITVVRVIADLKLAERKLRESEATLRKILESSPDAICIHDKNGRYLHVNPEFLRLTGYSREECIGKAFWELGIWPDRQMSGQFREAVLRDGEVRNLQAVFRTKEGRMVPSLISGVMLDLDGQLCCMTISRDISDLKATQLKLQQSEEYFRTLIESSSDVVLVISASGNIVFVGGAGRGELGYTAGDVLGTNGATLVHPDDLVRQAETTRDAFQNPGKIYRSDARIRSVKGEWVEFEFMGSATVDPRGNPIMITTMRNIAERKRAERELANARDQALAASKAKSEFLSSMSHEIRTPMNAILGMADLMSETELNSEQRRCLDTVIGNGTALLELINSILDLAKVESGRLSLEKVEFDVVELAEKVADTLAVRAHGKGLELVLHFAPDLPRVLIGDPLRIRQVLINLIGNAIKFTDKGQVVVEIDRNHDSKVPGNLRFSVRDSGIGIEADQLATIFSAFTQADSSTTRRYGGSGLGLAIVERLVTLMGGYVRAQSTLGQGSLFYFTVDLGVVKTSVPAIRPGTHPFMRGRRVLLVDDNAANREIARELLDAESAIVCEADSGAAGISAFTEAAASGKPFDLLLVDSFMPEMDGAAMLERIRQKLPSTTGVVMMVDSTGLTAKLTTLKGIGQMDYTVKPLKQRELYSKMQDVLAARVIPPTNGIHPPQISSVAGQNGVTARALQVLLADDSPDNRMLIKAYLKKTPHSLDEAENGQIAYDRFIAGKYDVVLMDIQMPILDGYTAVRMMREWEIANGRARTPIIALTASALDEAVRKARDAGCDMHVSKPVKKATLLEAITNSIEIAETVVV